MNIGDSGLFKDFARPVLEQSRAKSFKVSGPRLEMSTVWITNVTQENFSVSLEGRIKGVSSRSSIDPFELDMTFDGSCFGKLAVPKMRAGIWSADVVIRNQRLKILDQATFRAFIRGVIVDRGTCFLERGTCSVTSFGGIASYDLYLGPTRCADVRLAMEPRP